MKVNVISKFDLDSELFEAKRRCEWFIDGMGKHGLTVELFSMMSTEEICLIYNVELSYFKKDDGKFE